MAAQQETTSSTTTLVVGATGATGKWVVKLLLDQGQNVKVIVRSQEKMKMLLQEMKAKSYDQLTIIQSPLLDMTDTEVEEIVQDCDVVISCLGHTMDFKGMYGKKDRGLVTKSVKRLTTAMKKTTTKSGNKKKKFILMGSEGVANPNGTDDVRPLSERMIIFLLRYLVPPHSDNEQAAAYLHSLGSKNNDSDLEWLVLRPTDLIDGEPTGLTNLYSKPFGGLFGAGVVTRANVAQSMVDFVFDNKKFDEWKFQMPVIHDQPKDDTGKTEL